MLVRQSSEPVYRISSFCASRFAVVDFCAGGEMPGSPLGTIETILAQHGFNSGDLAYDSLQYYADVSDLHRFETWLHFK